jgi:hypothetical protein
MHGTTVGEEEEKEKKNVLTHCGSFKSYTVLYAVFLL